MYGYIFTDSGGWSENYEKNVDIIYLVHSVLKKKKKDFWIMKDLHFPLIPALAI